MWLSVFSVKLVSLHHIITDLCRFAFDLDLHPGKHTISLLFNRVLLLLFPLTVWLSRKICLLMLLELVRMQQDRNWKENPGRVSLCTLQYLIEVL